ncbi:hypothetical protein HPB50_022743 [Hyalomma asiaticum]|uniref:Uncharacterized protein n=1 Tax=Hyalomma asiaticum TaxID=266040 RepID=A0ACB7RSE2_HYAAI|nr:hypothetical protein HPB50_022743 [Hyalomma asiaticum]
MVLHLHDQLTLNLRKASVAAREFRVLEHEDGKEVMHFLDGRDLEENLHEDEKHYATVEVTRRDSGVEVEGLVGPNHRIEPMPTMERSDEGLIPHMIHEIEKKEMVDIQKAIPHEGIGYVGGLCTSFFVALGEDKAGHHTGMHTLTHETGHV